MQPKCNRHCKHQVANATNMYSVCCTCNHYATLKLRVLCLRNLTLACQVHVHLGGCTVVAWATWRLRMYFSSENRSFQQTPVVGRYIFSQNLIGPRESIDQSIKQSINRSIDQSINRTIDQSKFRQGDHGPLAKNLPLTWPLPLSLAWPLHWPFLGRQEPMAIFMCVFLAFCDPCSAEFVSIFWLWDFGFYCTK